MAPCCGEQRNLSEDLTYDLGRFAAFWVPGSRIIFRGCQSFPDTYFYSLLLFSVGTNNAAWRISKVTSSSTGSGQGHRGPHGVFLTPVGEEKGCAEQAAGNTYPQLVVELVVVRGFWFLQLWNPFCGSKFAWERWDTSHWGRQSYLCQQNGWPAKEAL